MVVVQKHHEAFPGSDEEGGSPVAQAFRRLGQCQANCAHPGERLGDLWGREPAHNTIRAARASRAGVRLLRRRSKTKRRVCSLLLSTAGARFPTLAAGQLELLAHHALESTVSEIDSTQTA